MIECCHVSINALKVVHGVDGIVLLLGGKPLDKCMQKSGSGIPKDVVDKLSIEWWSHFGFAKT